MWLRKWRAWIGLGIVRRAQADAWTGQGKTGWGCVGKAERESPDCSYVDERPKWI